jgi:putative transposase
VQYHPTLCWALYAISSVIRSSSRHAQYLTCRYRHSSLLAAVKRRQPNPGLIHHSDRGSQYCSDDVTKLLKRLHIKASMSRRGNCYDNAPMESFWGTLKNELVYHQHYSTREQAIREITEYIEIFYNRQRRQKKLGYLSPVVYEQQFYAGRKVA